MGDNLRYVVHVYGKAPSQIPNSVYSYMLSLILEDVKRRDERLCTSKSKTDKRGKKLLLEAFTSQEESAKDLADKLSCIKGIRNIEISDEIGGY